MNLADNKFLKEQILARMKQLDWKPSDLINDAAERNYFIDKSRFSQYKLSRSKGLNDENVLWIAERLGIPVNINFGSPTIVDGKIKYVIMPFDELQSLKRLNIIFPPTHK